MHFFALRGSKEHAFLLVNQIKFGTFEKGHPLEGMMFVKATDLKEKDTKITFTNKRRRDTNRDMRLPVDPLNLACPGGTLFRYVHSLAPSQERFYNYPTKANELAKLRRIGLSHVK